MTAPAVYVCPHCARPRAYVGLGQLIAHWRRVHRERCR